MRISDWSSDVCSSDLLADRDVAGRFGLRGLDLLREQAVKIDRFEQQRREAAILHGIGDAGACGGAEAARRSEARRVGTECVSQWRYRGGPTHTKKKQNYWAQCSA